MVRISHTSFTHNNEEYEVRTWVDTINDDNFFFVRVFKKDTNAPANGYEYLVKIEDQIDAKHMQSINNPLTELEETAKKDFTNGTWENFRQAYKEVASKGHASA